MKCWIAGVRDGKQWEWCALFHSPTRGKAKLLAQAIGGDDYISYGALRLPGLDDKPITYQNAKEAGFEYSEYDWDGEGELLPEDEFINECTCEICTTAQAGATAWAVQQTAIAEEAGK